MEVMIPYKVARFFLAHGVYCAFYSILCRGGVFSRTRCTYL